MNHCVKLRFPKRNFCAKFSLPKQNFVVRGTKYHAKFRMFARNFNDMGTIGSLNY